mgnify:CR=1 FL=1|tara:strand:+ start:122 stop:1051 length:930 start_codon:yes stop_codon:yes gene_type:complete
MTEEKKVFEQGFEDEYNLLDLFQTLWKKKVFIIVSSSVIAISSIFYALLLPNYYNSEAVLVVRSSTDSAPVSQFGITPLIGLNLTNSLSSESAKIIEIVKSREFVKHLIKFENILPSLSAAESYDSRLKKLNFDSKVYNAINSEWLGSKPTYIEAHSIYSSMLEINQDKLTGIISISMEHLSPIFAKEFLQLVIQEANNLNRESDIGESSKALSFLETELSQTSILDIRKSINQLIKSQLETRMLASIHDEYTLITLEPPYIPEQKNRPSRSFIVIFSTLLGTFLVLVVVIVREYLFKKNSFLDYLNQD